MSSVSILDESHTYYKWLFFADQKKESPNVRCDRWTLLNLYNENFVFINWDFFAVGQLNEPFITIVINDDAITVTFPWE